MCVCVEVEENAAETCLNEMQENQEVRSDTENETEKANGGTNRDDHTVKKSICHGMYENQYDNQQRRNKEKCSFDHLPNKNFIL